jgi:multicopper oxidase
MGGGMMGGPVPPYDGLLINGKLPDDPFLIETVHGNRLRLRVINAAGATTFRFGIGGHRILVTHADAHPTKPVEVNSLLIGMGECYDVIVDCKNSGSWPISAASVEGNTELAPARAILRYRGSAQRTLSEDAVAESLHQGRLLELADLNSLEEASWVNADDRAFDMVLSGGMMSSAWTINGQAYPDAEPLEIRRGEVVELRLFNHSMMMHPMHLHGHTFKVSGALKDTVIVPSMMGQRSIRFMANNPGRWLFHCHNLYHMESGMMREIHYS